MTTTTMGPTRGKTYNSCIVEMISETILMKSTFSVSYISTVDSSVKNLGHGKIAYMSLIYDNIFLKERALDKLIVSFSSILLDFLWLGLVFHLISSIMLCSKADAEHPGAAAGCGRVSRYEVGSDGGAALEVGSTHTSSPPPCVTPCEPLYNVVWPWVQATAQSSSRISFARIGRKKAV